MEDFIRRRQLGLFVNQFTIYVPKTYNDGTPIPKSYFEFLEDYLLNEYNTYSRRDVFGAWASPTLGVIREHSNEYFIYGRADRRKIFALAKIIKSFWKQQSVMVVINGKEVFV